MAVAPTPEEVARLILERFSEAGAREGHALRMSNMVGVQTTYQLTGQDLTSGLQYALDQGWLVQPKRDSFHLTALGFSEM